MSISEEVLTAGTDSFWDVGGYKNTVKRCEEGLFLSQKLGAMVQERADIEKHYATELKEWSKKWNKFLESGSEYGTSKSAWQSFLVEAESVADMHLDVKNRLSSDVQNNLKQWRSDKYHKSVVGQTKETKQFDDEFKKAQKPWAKKLSKVLKAKKDFHNACRAEKTAIHQEGNGRNDSAISADQLKKLQQKMEKCKEDVESTRQAYETSLNEINENNARYMEDMTEVFNKTQDFENQRLQFFQSVFLQIHSIVNIAANPEFPRIFDQFRQTIQSSDSKKDLKWWSQSHGVDMAMAWPRFEEYSAEMNTLVREKKQPPVAGNDGVTLTNVQQPQLPQQHQKAPSGSAAVMAWSTLPAQPSAPAAAASGRAAGAASAKTLPPSNQVQNPFGDDWEQEVDDHVDESNGVLVKALYDHHGQEDDELSFRAGDIFVKLKDKDDLGWCTGKKDGRIGLFPDNYVEPVHH